MPKDPRISLVMATKLEAATLIDLLGLKRTQMKPFPLYGHDDLTLIISGIGKANAAIATTYTIITHRPGLVGNLGAAGATRSKYGLGDFCHINKVIEYDRPHLRTEAQRSTVPMVFPGFSTASLATRDKPVLDQKCRKTLAQCSDLVDMEAAGVMQACERFIVPCVIFKFVSDTPDHEGHDDIADHIKRYGKAFCETFVREALPLLREDILSR